MYNIIITLFVQGTNIICLYCVEIFLDAVAVIIYDNNYLKEKMVEHRECFQNGFGRGTKKFSLSLL